ncbi:potassium channel protein [Lignipirellula cremea]|uniref:Voltage-gated potassium channel n=1 Tax=Lignipirellula cremea TaxID=2528010 RepID=A0A518E0G6_9BACT|nr:potassium channel family protein [Lignipirellula cremea]QDU97586.1 voltage-gated potassium channel [Lignipirellula cremea]
MLVFTLTRIFRHVRRQKATSLLCVVVLLLVSVFGNATAFYLLDHQNQEDLTYADALWYSVISITTIGYGDYYAKSGPARLCTIFFVVVIGLAAFSMLLGMAIDTVAKIALREERGMEPTLARNHILIVNFPSAARVLALIEELQAEPGRERQEIVLVNDDIDTLPFAIDRVNFVRGPVLDRRTYERAAIESAEMAIVLATSYEDPRSDAVVASASAVIDRLKPEIYLVAECLQTHHEMLFDTVHCDAIVNTLQISRNLLAQEVHDPGITQMVAQFTSNRTGPQLYTCEVPPAGSPLSYRELAIQLLQKDAHLICVNRGSLSYALFTDLQPAPGDRVAYSARQRFTWDQMAVETA